MTGALGRERCAFVILVIEPELKLWAETSRPPEASNNQPGSPLLVQPERFQGPGPTPIKS